LGAELRQ